MKKSQKSKSSHETKISQSLLNKDKTLFLKDYSKYSIPGESKSQNIGEPFFLQNPDNRGGVILAHGYMAAPEEMRQLAEKIHKSGYAVYALRLRGHGTSPEDLSKRKWQEWNASIDRACEIMESRIDNFVLAGFSTGAGLTLLQAEEHPNRFKGIISISAPLELVDMRTKFVGVIGLYNRILNALHITRGRLEFVENEPDNPEINYLRNPVAGVNEVKKLMRRVKSRLRDIVCPALIIQGDRDTTVKPESAKTIYEKISSQKKEILFIESEKHCIIRDDKLDKIYKHIDKFLQEVLK